MIILPLKRLFLFLTLVSLIFMIGCGGKGKKGYVGESYTVVADLPEEGNEFDFTWEIIEQPDASLLRPEDLTLINDTSKMIFVPDVAGIYLFQVKVFQFGDELSTQSFQFNIREKTDQELTEKEVEEKIYAENNEAWLDEESGEKGMDIYSIEDKLALIEKEQKKKSSIQLAPGSGIPYNKNRFTIQVAAKKTFEEAESVAADLIDKGYNAYIQKAYFKETGTTWYRVRVGNYENKETALAMAKSISDSRNVPTWVDYVRLE